MCSSDLSHYLHARFRVWDADLDAWRIRTRTTGCTDRKRAQRIAQEYQAVAEAAAPPAHISRNDVVRFVEGILRTAGHRVDGVDLSLAQWRDRWLSMKRERVSPSTFERYQAVADDLCDEVGPRVRMDAVSGSDVAAFHSAMPGRTGALKSTADFSLGVIRQFFGDALKLGLISSNPASSVRIFGAEQPKKRDFTHEEIRSLLDAARGTDWETMCLLGWRTGARIMDCARMPWSAVRLDRGLLDYQPQKTKRKGRRVVVPLAPDLLDHLSARAGDAGGEPSGSIMPTLSGYSSTSPLSKQFGKLMLTAGLEPVNLREDGLGRVFTDISFHSFRHTFNSDLANLGVSQEVRMALTGHSTASVNAGYTHLDFETLRGAVMQLS